MRIFYLIKPAFIGKALIFPDTAEDIQPFTGATIAVVMGKTVAPPQLLGAAPAGDDVEQAAPTRGALQAGAALRKLHRIAEARLIGDHEAERLGFARQQRRNHPWIVGVGERRDQAALEAIAELGTHEALLAREGIYAGLYAAYSQASASHDLAPA